VQKRFALIQVLRFSEIETLHVGSTTVQLRGMARGAKRDVASPPRRLASSLATSLALPCD
jgi:hypothetical protein